MRDKRSVPPGIPLVVVGALRAGGSGKTSVTLALARELERRGLRPALLAYRLGPGRDRVSRSGGGPVSVPGSADTFSGKASGTVDLEEVSAGDEWPSVSDEALLLKRESGLRVFVTRDRASAWRLLQRERFQADGRFDILISDDGFQDPRLDGAFRMLLTAPGERPGLFDLLPGGPFRETHGAMGRADLRLEGPCPARVTLQIPKDAAVAAATATATASSPMSTLPGLPRFTRTLILPPDFDRERPWIAFCALGDNRPFLSDLERAGILPAAVVTGRNHAAPPLKKLQSAVRAHPGAGILCTRKDFLKLEAMGGGLPLHPLDQAIALDPEIPDAVMAWRLLSGNPYLVHYPG